MDNDAVVNALQVGLAQSPDDVELRLHLASRLHELGRSTEAVAHLHKLLAAIPTDTRVTELAQAVFQTVDEDQPADEADQRRAAPVAGDDVILPVPDTADELLDKWSGSEAPEELLFGEIETSSVKLDDVGGLDHVKDQIDRSFLSPLRNPELAAAFGKSAGGGLLLWGPPGCGKTFLARAIAGEMGANFYNVGLADVLDMWIGASERNLASVFDAARRNAPCVLFFDEIDALGQKRSNLRHAAGLRGVVNQLLSELDGVDDANDGLFVLAATNHPWDVDEALLRPGRFDRRVLVLPPDAPARRAILDVHLRDRPTTDLDLDRVVAATSGLSGADLAFIVERAVEECMQASIDAGDIVPVSQGHLERAADEIPSSIGPWLETARNHVRYANRGGDYDELEAWLNRNDGGRRRPFGR